MNEDVREIILLLGQRAKEKPISFATTVLAFMFGLYGVGSSSLLFATLAAKVNPILAVPVYPLAGVTFATCVTLFIVFFTHDVMEKSKKVSIKSFANRATQGVDYGFVTPLIKFFLFQLGFIIALLFIGVMISQLFNSQPPTEPSAARDMANNFSHLFASALTSIVGSLFAFGGVLRAYVWGIGAFSAESTILGAITSQYQRVLLYFSLFNALVWFCACYQNVPHYGFLITMTLTLIQAAGVIRHFMGDKAEEKKKEEAHNLAYNF